MGRSVDIDFTFDEPVHIPHVLRCMMASGMSFSRGGVVSYVFDEDDMFDWLEIGADSLDDLIQDMGDVRRSNATVGISVFLGEPQIGGDLLFYPERCSISFVISINRKNLPGRSKFCDLGWYLHRMVPVLEPLGLSEITARDSA